ncbi:plastocyanin/azurin family copper-binding protein [Halopenitus sp. H-Gu1]|uniref:plastocyanin/azurin family copper-binding protein n=1 Tax=Halopenitus sp. H-Gu1 TaxID=3242697 RepID=UPI00359F0EB9
MTQRLTRRDMLRSAVAATAVGLGGCLGVTGTERDSPPEDAGELGTPAAEFRITIISEPFPEFEPQIVHVEPGTTVEWFVETGRHDVTAYHRENHPPHRMPEGAEAWESDYLTGPGASYKHTFDREGIYDYVDTQQVCVSHEVAGNVGRVVVGWPDLETQPAMAAPSEELPSQVANAIELFNEETRAAVADRDGDS